MQKAVDLESAKAAEAPRATPSVRLFRSSSGFPLSSVHTNPLTVKSEHAIRPTIHVRRDTPCSACPPVALHHSVHCGVVAHRRHMVYHDPAASGRPTRSGSVASQWARDMFRAVYRDIFEQGMMIHSLELHAHN